MEKIYRSEPIQLSDLLFKSENINKDIQILRVGKFFVKDNEIEITKNDLKKMVKNFSENVRKIDLMVDFSHESEKEAAAWIQNLWLSENESELWATVEWTHKGEKSVRGKEYRYISADFHYNYIDNETLQEHGPTLFGAALTNRPVVKGMTPTILSETYNKGNKMNLEEKIKKLEEALACKDKKIKEMQELMEKMKNDKKMAEDNKEAEKLAEDREKFENEKAEFEKEKKINEKEKEFNKLMSDGKACEAQRESFMNDNFKEFAEKAASVNLNESGHGKDGDIDLEEKTNTPAQDKVLKLAEEKVKKDEISLSEAIKLVLSEDKKLAKDYEKETEI